MTHGKCCTPPKPTPRVAGTAPLTAAMAAWTSSFDLLPPRAPAPAEQLFAAGWSAHFVSSIKIMAGKMKSRSGPIWPLTPKPTWAGVCGQRKGSPMSSRPVNLKGEHDEHA